MSKTDKTRPWKIRATERPMVTCVPVHRHHLGNCDLPENPADAFSGAGSFWIDHSGELGDQICFWTWTPGFFYGRGGGTGCQCWMCGDTEGRTRRHRHERRRTRRELRHHAHRQ